MEVEAFAVRVFDKSDYRLLGWLRTPGVRRWAGPDLPADSVTDDRAAAWHTYERGRAEGIAKAMAARWDGRLACVIEADLWTIRRSCGPWWTPPLKGG